MTKQYCKQYFYPEERYNLKCEHYQSGNGICHRNSLCAFQLNLTPEQHMILDNLRIIKVQDAQIAMELVKQRQK